MSGSNSPHPDPFFQYARVPLAAARDHRLAGAHYRILIALLRHLGSSGRTVWPSRERLARLTDYSISSISRYTAQLERLGWVKKFGAGGRGCTVRYQIQIPSCLLDEPEGGSEGEKKTVANPETVAGYATVACPSTKTVAYHATQKDKKKEVISPLPLPSDFAVTPEDVEYARARGLPNPHQCIEQFRLYHKARGTHLADWRAEFRRWLINEPGFQKTKRRKYNETGRGTDSLAEIEREFGGRIIEGETIQ